MIYVLIAAGIVLGGIVVVIGAANLDRGWSAMAFIAGCALMLGLTAVGIFYTDITQDRERCVKVLPTTTGRETKWERQECFVRDGNGWVPIDWLESEPR